MNPSIVAQLQEARSVICTVESCTGGAIAMAITEISGSSRVFWGSIVAYDNSAKHSQLGVPLELLKTKGAVSSEVAKALAESGLSRMRASLEQSPSTVIPNRKRMISVSTTGVAGPSGGTPEKPVGLCFLALARTDGDTIVREIRAPKAIARSRAETRAYFVDEALKLVSEIL